MALFFSMKEALSIELGRYYRAWDWEDLQFGEVRPSTLFETADAEVDFTYRGITRTIAYKRFDPNWFFVKFPFYLKPIELEQDLDDKTAIAEYLNGRYGIPFEAADVADGGKLIAAAGRHVLAISPNSPNYNVNLTYISAALSNTAGDYDQGWELNGNGESSVEDGVALTADFDYVTLGSRLMATHKTPRNDALGVSLRAKGDFTLKFNIVPLDTVTANVKQGLFGTASGDDVGQALSVALSDGKWVVTCPGNRSYFTPNAGALRIGKSNEVTVRGINGGFEFYLNKTLYAIIDAVDQFDAWTHFGKAGEFLTDRVLISDIRYWENAINTPVLQAQSSKQDVRMMHYVEHDWLISAANPGRRDSTRVNPAQLYYAVDFTPQAQVLKTIPQKLAPYINGSVITDTPTLTKLRNAIQAVDPSLTWDISGVRTANSLYGCWAAYNGKTVEFNDPTKTSESYLGLAQLPAESKWMQGKLADETFDNVLFLLLESAYPQLGTLRVPLLLHYNDEI